ncbi:O-succinylhomoserine (thiol)-lyase [Alkalicaulis satelles]|uniref:O-succinylhomoserine (Thiol)-lyase n=1 Tax=Alkalicaulis satelles TaxID=2609175 RepID=A0A5M6ZI98_9PROT|nr:PLP-dependent transferase [Alkalicaulis satelles]KAA5803427.1 O-succinylhomoserine (thiol)-lyase [Alkalicaulis satelles]
MTRFSTRAARAGINADPAHGAVVAPVSLSAAYRRDDPAAPGPFDYARTAHPGRDLLARTLADLDGASGAVVTASGMAAIDLVLNDLPIGARIVCAHDCYGGTRRLFDARARQRGFDLVYADCTDPEALSEALKPGAALAFFETPSNPRLRITDLEAACALARKAGAVSVVDNTVLSPALQRPLELGADIALASLTKLINGHSDMVGGVVCVREAELAERLSWWANAAGTGGAAFDAFLALRGLRTLPVRARVQSEAALELASRLNAHRGVARVDYPGLKGHPGHAIAARQQDGFGPLLSFELSTGVKAAHQLTQRLSLFTLAQSLGGTESLVAIPALMTHAAMSPEARAQAGVGDGLVRLSVGLEHVDDLWDDLAEALEHRA